MIYKNSIATMVLFILSFTSGQLFAQLDGNGEILGTAVDTFINEPLAFAHILAESEGSSYRATTNGYGVYYINPLPEGLYKVSLSYMGTVFVKNNVRITSGKSIELNFNVSTAIGLPPVVIEDVPGPLLIDPLNPYVDLIITDKDIKNKPSISIEDLVGAAPFVYQEDKKIHIKGAREAATRYMIDGMMIMGSHQIPISSIRSLEVIASGIEAKFGDTTGGIIYIRTKGYFN